MHIHTDAWIPTLSVRSYINTLLSVESHSAIFIVLEPKTSLLLCGLRLNNCGEDVVAQLPMNSFSPNHKALTAILFPSKLK